MSRQRFTGETVLAAARRRVAFAFDHFETIVVSVSGGKDSTCLAHLALTEAARRNRRLGIFFLDEEVVYQSSVEQVDYLMSLMPDSCQRLWLQIPFLLTNATSLDDGQLHAWAPGEHKRWMRPKKEYAIKAKPWSDDDERFRSKAKGGVGYYGVIDNFAKCYPGAAFFVGIRAAGESPNRWRAVVKNPVQIGGQNVYWATAKSNTTALYPIYDWIASDVWKYIATEGIKYSRIYDFQHKMGYPLNERRVSSLIHEKSFRSIADLPAFEPKTYARLLKRIKGIALAQETGRAAKLFRCRKLPKNFHSWRIYRDFLLTTYPDPEHKPLFERRFSHQRDNEYVARQQCRQLICNDYENNLTIDDDEDPREALIRRYEEEL